eukprot:jgi/Tetstr1/420483/TSEL_011596.t1
MPEAPFWSAFTGDGAAGARLGSAASGLAGSKRSRSEPPSPLHSTPQRPCGDWHTCSFIRRLANAQTGWTRSRAAYVRRMQQICATMLPGQLQEKRMPPCSLKAYDKAFSAAWASDDVVLVGTKCNKLVELNFRSGTSRALPQQLRAPPVPGLVPPSSPDNPMLDGPLCGIRCLAMSPNRSMVALPGEDPRTACVLRLPSSPPSSGAVNGGSNYTHLKTFCGHSDWIFGITWITDRHVATCSRDCSIALWSLASDSHSSGAPSSTPFIKHAVTQRGHSARVRDLRFCQNSKRMASLGTDAIVSIWDAQLQPVRQIGLDHKDELVCLAQREDLVAVGSQNYVMLADPRAPRGVANIPGAEHNQSVRSITFHHDLITIGSGYGRISFYDLRAGRFLKWHEDALGTGTASSLRMDQGWLAPNMFFGDEVPLEAVSPACYAHSWDPSGTRLFACGGPLASGMIGCYMGLWE